LYFNMAANLSGLLSYFTRDKSFSQQVSYHHTRQLDILANQRIQINGGANTHV